MLKIGNILANIHNIESKEVFFETIGFFIDWEYYIKMAEKINPQIAQVLKNNLNIIVESLEKGNLARKNLPKNVAICHGDLDCKNVLW